MLKTKQNQEGFDALSEAEQAHYTKGADGSYSLQHDEAVSLKKALNGERSRAETAEKLLKLVVPDLPDDKTEWATHVTEQAEALVELRTIDLDEWHAYKEVDDPKNPGQKKTKPDIDAERLELQKQLREVQRERDGLSRDKTKLDTQVKTLRDENLGLARTSALNEALDAVKITDPADREVVTALLQMRGMEAQEVSGQGRVFFVKNPDGSEMPLSEYTKDFVSTDQGKRYVKAPDSAGAGDGKPVPAAPVAKTAFDNMSPSQKLGAALSPGGVAGGAAPPAR